MLSRWNTIGTTFRNKSIRLFHEFVKFTSVDKADFQTSTIQEITLPQHLTDLVNYAFYNTQLKSIILHANISSIGNNTFQLCRSLTDITILKSDGVVTLGTKALDLTNSLAHIYVPADLVDSYKSASGWSSYSSKISAIQE